MPIARRRNNSRLIACNSMEDVIKALDGGANVAKLTGRSLNHLGNWRNDTGRFPANTYLVMRKALAEKGYEAPPALWGMLEP